MRRVEAVRNTTRPGLNITFDRETPAQCSAEWSVAGWKIQFFRLLANETATVDQSRGVVHVKVVTGALTAPALVPFADPGQLRRIAVDESSLHAGPDGAILAVMTETPDVPDNLNSMHELALAGPDAEGLQWELFFDRFGGAEVFSGVDAHIVPGFHLLDSDGSEIAYIHFWTMGKGGDASTHNHGHRPSSHAPAFAETHFVFNNGTGAGGMYRCAEPGAEREMMVMQRGEEHGPLWAVDPETGMPARRPNGAVEYGWHGWKAGTNGHAEQAYDFVAAFEINPDLAPVGR